MPEVQADRANTLDGILEELPDFSDGYFSYPVEDFFPQYVERLGQGGLQEPAQGSGDAGMMQFSDLIPNDDSFPSASSEPIRNGHGQQQQSLMAMDLESFDMQEPAVYLPQNTGQMQNGRGVQYPTSMMQMPFIGNAPQTSDNMHSEGSGSGDQGNRSSSRGRASKGRASPDFHLDSGDDSDDIDQFRKGTRAPGKPKRNAKQQAQNKQAQQRYRERRKQRFNDMEHAIDELNGRLQQMQAIKNQNAVLTAKSHELTSMIEAKNAEIDKLRGQMQATSISSPATEESYEQRRQAEEALLSDMKGENAKNVEKMKEFIERHKLQTVNPTGEGVDPQIMQQMAEMLGSQCASEQNRRRPDGVKLLRLMSADYGQLSRIKCIRKRDSVSKGLENLRLTDVQKQQLLMLRTNHLSTLKDVYVERQQLNMQAMAFMLPNNDARNLSLESKLERMRHASYRRMAAHAVDLDEILSSLKENLQKEQRRVMELNFLTLHKILSPIQAAIYMVNIFPMSFDALELANYLASEADSSNRSGQSSSDQHPVNGGSPEFVDTNSPLAIS